MKPAPFELHRPRSLDDAVALLGRYGEDARPLAGGQSLVVLMNLRMATPGHLVDLNAIEGLAGIAVEGQWLCIGAMTRQSRLLDDPLVARHVPLIAAAMPHIGHVQTRSRGTVGGSLAHADPAAELPLLMATLRASFRAVGPRGERLIEAGDFFRDALVTDLAPDEVLAEIRVPVAPPASRVAFVEFSRRHGDFAMVSAAAQWTPGEGQARVGIGGASAVPLVCTRVEAAMENGDLMVDFGAEVARLVDLDLGSLDILSDPQVDEGYRRKLAAVAVSRCIGQVLAP